MKNFELVRFCISSNGDDRDGLLFSAGDNPKGYRELLDRIARSTEKKKDTEKKPSVPNDTGIRQKDTENKKCGICLEGFKPHSKIVNCNCERSYHILCATQVGECPICDADLQELSSKLMDRGKVRDYSFIWGK